MKRDFLNSPRLTELKNKRRKDLLNKIYISVLACIVILFFFVYLSRIDKLNISGVEVTGNKVTDTALIKATVNKTIAGDYLLFFPKTNIFFYPKDKIEQNLRDNFKRLQNINVYIKDNKFVEIDVTERTPKYTWCGENLPDNSKDTCYFTDDTGYIFDQAPYFSGNVYFKFYGKLSGSNPVGQYFNQNNFKKLLDFKNTLEAMGLLPTGIYVGDNDDTTVLLAKNKDSTTTPKIIFKISDDVQKVAENLQAALGVDPLQTDFKKKYSSLLYIDLRFGNKVYYKFQQ